MMPHRTLNARRAPMNDAADEPAPDRVGREALQIEAARRRRARATAWDAISRRPAACCWPAPAASSSPAWASRATSAARSPRRSPPPARPPSSCTRPKPAMATSAWSRASDVVLAISNSGETAELLTDPAALQAPGRAADRDDRQPATRRLRASRDVHLDVSVPAEACPLNLAPTASTTATLAMGDALAVALLEAARVHRRGFRALASGRRARPQAAAARRRTSCAAATTCPWCGPRRRSPRACSRCRASASA